MIEGNKKLAMAYATHVKNLQLIVIATDSCQGKIVASAYDDR
jgi:hypothetical protein